MFLFHERLNVFVQFAYIAHSQCYCYVISYPVHLVSYVLDTCQLLTFFLIRMHAEIWKTFYCISEISNLLTLKRPPRPRVVHVRITLLATPFRRGYRRFRVKYSLTNSIYYAFGYNRNISAIFYSFIFMFKLFLVFIKDNRFSLITHAGVFI